MDFGSTTKDFTRSAEAGEGDTIFARKRLRRVSFADTTAIHFFDRDEDVETPPDAKVGAEGSSQSGLGNEPLGFQGDGTDSEDTRSSPCRLEDGDDDDDEDGGDEHELFVRRYADSSSPCSTAGSVSSNDGDNLFGPVSTSFIRSGGLSEVSDDNNHDITLDSTAFSMHFSNILPLDDPSINSVESPRTPTGLSVTNDSEGFVLHSDAKKIPSRFGLLKANGYSSDMTLVAEYSNRYDYGKLSPTLQVLLAKVNETIQPQSLTDESKSVSSCKTLAEDPEASVSEKIRSSSDAVASTSIDDVYKAKPSTFVSADVSNININSSPSVRSQKHYSAGSHFRDETPENEHRSKISQVFSSDSPAQMTINDRSVSCSHEGRMHTPTGYQNTNRTLHSASEASISSLRTKRRQLLDDASRPFESEQKLSFSGVQSALSSKTKVIRDSERTSLIKNCNAEFENFEIEESVRSKSRSQLSARDYRLHGLKSMEDDNGSKGCGKRLDTSADRRDEQGMDTAGMGASTEMDHEIHVDRPVTPGNIRRSIRDAEKNVLFESSKQAEEIIQMPESGIRKDVKARNFDNFTEKHASSPASSYSREQILDILESAHAGSTFRTFVSSPKSILEQKLSVQKGQCFTPLVNDSILTRIVESTRLPFSQLANRLDLPELDALEDLVCQLKNARKYETLCSHIQTTLVCKMSSSFALSEIRLLKETLLYEQARLQLRSIKHDRLLKKSQELQSRIHDISKLRLSFMQLMGKQLDVVPATAPKNVSQVIDPYVYSSSCFDFYPVAVFSCKIYFCLIKFFGAHYNVNGTLSHDELIKVISDHFRKWNDRRTVCQRLQLWKLVDVMNQTDQCDILLNYCDFFSHRFSISFTPASRFGVDLLMNDGNIEKSFPNMRAPTAFHAVFNESKRTRRLSSMRCFQNEIQAASFILGNLLDVLEELQSAQVLVSSLIWSTRLQLQFVDLKTGRKVVLALDMTDLNCRLLPLPQRRISEPSELRVAVLCSPAAPEDVAAAVRSLKGGRPALLRLCRACPSSSRVRIESPERKTVTVSQLSR
ncbi:unnamed protein product [Spirodela intermedia]|uniref:Uncharacterized protein n=1 Tax=Spirodela intermedia TaxID=51605 RepID=A0A7I8JMN5_SPIIN|nr:unnamed protein product [Spirodela intermedia]CAA6670722.1 unnamed protein product [Spirodela intermedia]